MHPYFITSSGTGIGKTLVTTALCWQLRHAGRQVTALKPVISGFSLNDPDSDSALILRSGGFTSTPQMIDAISPWQFAAPLSPSLAAKQEGTKIDMDKLLGFCHEHGALPIDVLLIEGAGGVMAPLTEKHTMLDWMVALNWPVILVGGTYLGSLSHTLTALETLRVQGLSIKAVIINESEGSTVTLMDTIDELTHFMPPGVPLVKIPRLRAQAEMWQHVPHISWIFEGKEV